MAISKLQTFKAAAWLGWQIDANWTDFFVFTTYTMIRPAFGMLTFAFMYFAASAGSTPDIQKMAYLLVGSSLFGYAAQAIWGSSFAIHEDREHYLTIRYLCIAPSDLTIYYLGRISAPVLFSSTVSLIVNLCVGIFLLGMKVNPTAESLYYLLASIWIVALGIFGYSLIIAGIGFFTTRYIWGLLEGISGLSFLLGGIIFPPEVLPPEIRWLSAAIPWYYWIEMMRSPIIGAGIGLSIDFITCGAIFSAFFLSMGIYFFNWSMNRAKKQGTLDAVINW